MSQQGENTPSITIDGNVLTNVNSFKYLGSTISNTISLDTELTSRIGKASGVMSKLSKRVWTNKALTTHTKLRVYSACVISMLLYGAEAWTLYAKQEKRLNSFHLHCLRRILDITWQQQIPDTEVLEKAKIPSMFAILRQRRLRWLGHVNRMPPSRLPRMMLFSELASGTRTPGRPLLRFKDVCKSDLKATNIGTEHWQSYSRDRENWRSLIKTGVKDAENSRITHQKDKRERRKNQQMHPTTFICPTCSRDCHSRIGLHSHSRHCRVTNQENRAVHRQP